MMTTYEQNRRRARNEYYKVLDELEKFAKRSKHISITTHDHFFGSSRYDIRVLKEGKVVREMYAYLLTLASEHSRDEGKHSCDWFVSPNYYGYTTEEEEEECKNEWCFCVYHW